MQTDSSDGSSVTASARQDALDAADYVRELELSPDRWRLVVAAVDALDAALAADDGRAFWDALCDLEQVSPFAASSLEDLPTEPATKLVRDRINELIHVLDASSRPPPSEPDE